MNFQEYLDSLNVGDTVIINDKNSYYECVVSKITPTRIFKISRRNDNYAVYSFNSQGQVRGNKYFTEIVNKFNTDVMEKARLSFAKDKMLVGVCRIVSFLEKQKSAYSTKNNDIVRKIHSLLEEWENT